MPDIMESLSKLLHSFVDEEPKPPLHVGEVMSLWTSLTFIAEGLIAVEVGLNTTTDPELAHTLQEAKDLCDSEVNRVRNLLIAEGIPLPELSEPKPKSDSASIPLGVKLTDDEIANALIAKSASAISFYATAIAQAIRSDIGILFTRMLHEQLIFSNNVKSMMRQRGWLKVPPAFQPNGSPE